MTVFLLYYNSTYLFGTGCSGGWIILILLLWLCSILQLKSEKFSVIIEHTSLPNIQWFIQSLEILLFQFSGSQILECINMSWEELLSAHIQVLVPEHMIDWPGLGPKDRHFKRQPENHILRVKHCLRSGLSISALQPFWLDEYLLWGCFLNGRIFSSIPSLYQLDASNTPTLSVVANKSVPGYCLVKAGQMVSKHFSIF